MINPATIDAHPVYDLATLDIPTIATEEVISVIGSIRDGSASGIDCIPAFIIKGL